ncbi:MULTISPECIES: DNA alkylation repair protein [Cryobacterium]|uniref:DNA alkylation repair protein n=1 Tax=Cryobacterium breve TaxID=1259258 RepID=A0ABY2J846_9MICO|nr:MULTISPECIES: DNA alkylation repair protein [Cryobacterium]TFC91187.1 DNA alkylation repair protein [Cryobacterium sp. TmT3-12]TFD01118.1 DNA alkylation repair protein [Cryobacterium breve]
MSDAGSFVDATLQAEGDDYRAAAEKERLGSDLRFYGASVGAVRGTIRDAARRYPGLTHDDVTALSTELWAVPVFERRLAAVVLLQSNVWRLDNSDLTRIEGFLRSAGLRELVDPIAVDVVGPLLERLAAPDRARASSVLDRWAGDSDRWLRRAALLAAGRSEPRP